MKSSLTRTRWAAIGAAVAVTFGGGAVFVANAASTATTSDAFFAITPCRLLDTRDDGSAASKTKSLGIRNGVLESKTKSNTDDNDITVIFDSRAVANGPKFTRRYTLPNTNTTVNRPIMGDCDALFALNSDLENAAPNALLLNVTTVGSTANGFITIYPWKAITQTDGVWSRPAYSNLNPIANFPSVSNNVTVRLSKIKEDVVIPDVACSGGTIWGSENCRYATPTQNTANELYGFRLFNENGFTHVIIDVLGYYGDYPI